MSWAGMARSSGTTASRARMVSLCVMAGSSASMAILPLAPYATTVPVCCHGRGNPGLRRGRGPRRIRFSGGLLRGLAGSIRGTGRTLAREDRRAGRLGGAMKLEILQVPDCPNAAVLAARLAELAGARPDLTVTRQIVTTARDARRLGMTGSPTLLADGTDPF